MSIPSDQFAAQIAGVEAAIAIMRDRAPDLSNQWRVVETDMKDCIALQHPDESVMNHVRQAIRPLARDPHAGFIPGIDAGKTHRGRVVYVRKP